MSSSVTLVDYGLSNLFNVHRALEYVGGKVVVTSDPDLLSRAERLVVPGVAAFGEAMRRLNQLKLIPAIRDHIRGGRPFLGICLGMQMLFTESEELGLHRGLNLFQGRMVRLPDAREHGAGFKVPNIGWHRLLLPPKIKSWEKSILADISSQDTVYFIHSYISTPTEEENVIAQIQWGSHQYAVAIQKENVHGLQFHPEKSGEVGLKILKRFLLS